ncbi:MAG TPA: AAA family ATPase, partial [Hyalangium sp.]|nr:AAA family ATPase [Hyalangium sp.]
MKVQLGDSVVFKNGRERAVGIVERRSGRTLSVRIPAEGNQIERVEREEVEPLALKFRKSLEETRRPVMGVSIAGRGTLAELVKAFGYTADQRMNGGSLNKVMRQLERAGLDVETDSGDFDRNDFFGLALKRAILSDDPEEPEEGQLKTVNLPESFWPRALGLTAARELALLRALMDREPLLCLLSLPEGAVQQAWLQATWEGLLSWAFHAAQRFVRATGGFSSPHVVRGPAALLHSYLKPTAISDETLRLNDSPHSLNLVVLKQETESPVDFQRLQAIWPGPVFEFVGADAETSSTSLARLLLLVGGRPDKAVGQVDSTLSPLKLLLWSREASAQVMAQATAQVGEILAGDEFPRLRGSNEGASALALKAHLAHWVKHSNPHAHLQFEKRQVEGFDEDGHTARSMRVDLVVDERNLYEVETLVGSGPVEAFYHQKVFSRLKEGTVFNLVVPADALLWAGPFLADIAHHLGARGRVLLPAAGGVYAQIAPRALSASDAEVRMPESVARVDVRLEHGEKPAERPVTLEDIAGYDSARRAINEKIIWVEKHHHLTRALSRTTGILFFGPPGCGKSRLARAIAGTLEHEVRLLGPADLRGPYIGWGQVMIREQFDWAAERERRMLVIDELDAVARSRRNHQMHSDEKADVNELLVQLDRIGRLGRL